MVKRRCVNPFSGGNFEDFCPVEVLGCLVIFVVSPICGSAWCAWCAWSACFSVVGGSGC